MDDNFSGELKEIRRNNSELENSESLDSGLESPKSPSSKAQEIKCNDVEDGECSDSENKKLEDNEKIVEEELEEGEISNDDDTSVPETLESRNVCKFFLRGRCSWGPDCRFLHCVLTDKGDLEPVTSVVSHMLNPAQVGNVWEHSLNMAKSALEHSDKYKKKLQEEESDHESKKMSSSEIRFTRYPQKWNYSPELNYKRQNRLTYEPEYTRIRPRESYRSYSKRDDRDLYKSKRPKREVSIPREKEVYWTDSWMRAKSSAGPKRRRNYSSSSSSTSDSSSSDSSSTSRDSSRSHKRYNRRNWENERSLNHKEIIKGLNRSDKFKRSRKQNTTNHEKARTHKETKRSMTSSSSSSDSDRSDSKTRNRNKRRRSDINLEKNRQRSSSPPAASKKAHSKKNLEKRKILLEKLKNIEKAIAKHKKH